MQISFTECTRKTRKWYRKLFFHLLDLCLYNAYVLYKVNTGKHKVQFSEFHTNVSEQLLETHAPVRSRNSGRRPSSSASPSCNPLCLTGLQYNVMINTLQWTFQSGILYHQYHRLSCKDHGHSNDVMFVPTQSGNLRRELTLDICVLTVMQVYVSIHASRTIILN